MNNNYYSISQIVGETVFYLTNGVSALSKEKKAEEFNRFIDEVETSYGRSFSFVESNMN